MVFVSVLLLASCLSHVIGSALPNAPTADLVTRDNNAGEKVVIIDDDDFLHKIDDAVKKVQKRQNGGKDAPYIDSVINLLKKGLTIDGKHPPVGEIDVVPSSDACKLTYNPGCLPAATFTESVIQFAGEATATELTNVDAIFKSPSEGKLEIESKVGTARGSVSEEGWSIGLSLGGSGSSLSAQLSGEYRQMKQTTFSETVESGWKGECPANTECQVITATYLINLKGKCKQSPRAYCLSGKPTKRDMCADKENFNERGCPAHKEIIVQACPKVDQEVPCEISFPLMNSDGKLRTVRYLRLVPLKG